MLPPETKSQKSFWPENTKKNFFDQKWLEMSLKLIPAKLGFIKTFSFIVINLTIKLFIVLLVFAREISPPRPPLVKSSIKIFNP